MQLDGGEEEEARSENRIRKAQLDRGEEEEARSVGGPKGDCAARR